jgi:putative ABC transport system ATP-binding protein
MNQISYCSMSLLVILILEQQVSTFQNLMSSIVSVMDLLLNINRVGPAGEGELTGTTCVMVTHNPELECYADRILYVQDGVFVKQAINAV